MSEPVAGYEAARGLRGRRAGRGTGSSKIRRAAPVPYYAQLAEILRGLISEGTWAPGQAIPSEAELCATYGLSRTAVRQALDELVAEGLVLKERGRGTFVSSPKVADIVIQELRGFADEMSAHGHVVGTAVLLQQIEPSSALVANDLRVLARHEVVHIARVRTVDGEPVVKTDSWLPADRFPGLADEDLEHRSLYDVLRERYGVVPRSGRRRVEAAVASRELATELAVDIGTPLLHVVAVTYDGDAEGKPFELFSAFYRGDRTSFEIVHAAEDDA